MIKVDRVAFRGFRRLREVEVQARPFMVLVGANGIGKTSLLDAISLLSSSASGRLNSTLSEMKGIASLLTRGKSDALGLAVDMTVPGQQPLKYEIDLVPSGNSYTIAREVLAQDQGRPNLFKHIDSERSSIRYFDPETRALVRPTWEHDPHESSLAQVPKMYRLPEELRRILATVSHYHVLDVGHSAPVRLPQPFRPSTLPGDDGRELVSCLYTLRESDRGRYETVIDSLKAAFPAFQELAFPPVASGMLTMTWKDSSFNSPIYVHELSEGILRFLWLVVLLQSPNLTAFTMIDEPEVSLHPELLSLLAQLMREASERTQLIVATHSDRFIRFLKPEEVLVMDLDEDGCATATWADSLDLDQWLADYSLDEVWRMGRMGGRSL